MEPCKRVLAMPMNYGLELLDALIPYNDYHLGWKGPECNHHRDFQQECGDAECLKPPFNSILQEKAKNPFSPSLSPRQNDPFFLPGPQRRRVFDEVPPSFFSSLLPKRSGISLFPSRIA
ncbi:hypothetical protein VNO77_37288 [Canavalia gladiata]|uniref:Uncharacterized protein n=1 Tax=Canavalia gladiata TaxID=3824 RepID=A0AAN9K828_CANGL